MHDDTLATLKKRLNAARKRAAYWSGRPSGRGFGFSSRAAHSGQQDEEYETAMTDCDALADAIAEITGKRPTVTDYREDFRNAFAEAMSTPKTVTNVAQARP